MFKRILCLAALVLGAVPAAADPYKAVFPDRAPLSAEAQTFLESLDYQRGEIKLGSIGVTLKAGKDFYYLSPADTRKVLVDAWGNPPAQADDQLGMLFPVKYSPLDKGSWATVITFNADGYVSDEDATSLDFDALLGAMKESIAEASKEREKAGYGSLALIGWASPPFYDRASHKLHWARELEFGGKAEHTLNYAVRALGRSGVLEMNFVAGMAQLDEIKASIPAVVALADFGDGKRYTDYLPGDKAAGYGIAGVIGGVAAAKLAGKVGLLALGLVFLKKGWIFVVLALGGIVGFVRRRMASSSKSEG